MWYCDFNLKMYISFSLVLAKSCKNPQNFLSEETGKGVLCYVNEVNFGKPLGHLRIGAGCQGNEPCDWKIGTFSPTLQEGSGAGEWTQSQMAKDLTNRDDAVKRPQTPERTGLWELPVGEPMGVLGECGSSFSFPMHLSHLAVPKLYLFIINR